MNIDIRRRTSCVKDCISVVLIIASIRSDDGELIDSMVMNETMMFKRGFMPASMNRLYLTITSPSNDKIVDRFGGRDKSTRDIGESSISSEFGHTISKIIGKGTSNMGQKGGFGFSQMQAPIPCHPKTKKVN